MVEHIQLVGFRSTQQQTIFRKTELYEAVTEVDTHLTIT